MACCLSSKTGVDERRRSRLGQRAANGKRRAGGRRAHTAHRELAELNRRHQNRTKGHALEQCSLDRGAMSVDDGKVELSETTCGEGDEEIDDGRRGRCGLSHIDHCAVDDRGLGRRKC